MKKILNYVILYIITIGVLFLSLCLTSTIPRSKVEPNLMKSIDYYKKVNGIERIKYGRIDTYIHYFSDTRKLNILYNIDSKHPIKSTLWSKYTMITHMDTNKDFIDTVTRKIETNDNYLRYWNGIMLILRPLLTIFDMSKIYFINKILLAILGIILLVLLFRRSKKLSIIFLLSLLLTTSWYVSYCIEYSAMFYVMIITTILALLIDNPKNDISKNNSKLFILFFITGIVTTFFEFLTNEILTILIPLLFIIIIRKEENRLDFKDTIKFALKSCTLWFVAYGLTWLVKWVLASLILHIDAFKFVKHNFFLRFNGLQGLSDHKRLYLGSLEKNIFGIPLMYIIRQNISNWKTIYFITVFILILLVFISWKELKNKKYLIFLLIIGLMPYIRYLILANHSFRHAMFTFRDQILTLICLIYFIVDNFNYKLIFKKIEIKVPESKKVKK